MNVLVLNCCKGECEDWSDEARAELEFNGCNAEEKEVKGAREARETSPALKRARPTWGSPRCILTQTTPDPSCFAAALMRLTC